MKRRLVHVTTTDMSLDWLLGPQLRAFADHGYEVIGISAPGEHVGTLSESGIQHVPVRHATRELNPLQDARAFGELWRLFRHLRPDIVHTHNPKPGVYGRLAARAAGVPVIVNTCHGLYALPDDRRLKRALVYGAERVAAACSHVELVQNPEDLDVLASLGVPRSRLRLLGNGVDLARFDPSRVVPRRVQELRHELGLTEADVLCGAVGRLVWEKGFAELSAAATLLQELAPEVRLVVAGPPETDKRDAVGQADLHRMEEAGVKFLGRREDMVDLYAAMDLYVLASHREGFPRSAMEAAAMGVAIVATDVRGCRQVVDHGVTGLLVPPRDPSSLARAIAELARDRSRRERMGEAARRKAVDSFDQRRVIELTLEVYERCWSERVGS